MNAEIFVTKQGSIGFARAGNLVIFVAEDRIREPDWQEWLTTGPEKLGLSKSPAVVSFTASKATPTALQRKQLGAEQARFGFDKVERNAILSDSAIVRGAITAIQWLLRSKTQMKAFRADHVSQALQWLHEREPFDLAEAETATRALMAATNAAYQANV